MNMKEILLIVLVALGTTWVVEYLFLGKRSTESTEQVQSGESFIAPLIAQSLKPLNKEIDFIDEKRGTWQRDIQVIETDDAIVTFSNEGASLDRLEFKRTLAGKSSVMTTVFPVGSNEKEKRCFLIGLDKESPYFYTLVKRNDEESFVELTYEASFETGKLRKKFTVFKDSFKIDLQVTVEVGNQLQDPISLRIFFPAPTMPDIALQDTHSGVMTNQKGSVSKIARSQIDQQSGWYTPTLFGTDDRYFVHAMVSDPAHFVQRAYYKLVDKHDLFAILESPSITESQSWNLSFYFGPKESKAMGLVDSRLEDTLGHAGWFSFISKFLLLVLQFFFVYFGNYGLAIIALTLSMRFLLWPFTITSARSMKSQSANGDLQKKLDYLEQRYKNDPQRLAQERAAAVKKHSSVLISGCLPLLLQFPIFIALNRVLSSSIEMYKAPFLWMADLSSSDPYYVFPVLIAVSMMIQALMVDRKQRMSMMIMALVLGVASAKFSAGLSLYIAASTGVAALQSWLQKQLKMV